MSNCTRSTYMQQSDALFKKTKVGLVFVFESLCLIDVAKVKVDVNINDFGI